MIETAAVLPTEMQDIEMSPLQRAFYAKNGFVLIRNLFTAPQAEELAAQATAEAGLSPQDCVTEADAVNRFPVALNTLTSPELTSRVRSILGEQVQFLQLSDLHQNHNSWSWHRDSVHRDFGIGQDFDESIEAYDISKLILYLHADAFGLALISGSHRHAVALSAQHEDFASAIQLTDEHILETHTFETGQLVLASPRAGDAILFDERLLHSGRPHNESGFTSELTARKMTLCWAFGSDGRHAHRFHSYFRFVRSNYAPLTDDARATLQAASLLPSWIDQNYFHEIPEELEGIYFPEPERQSPQVRSFVAGSASDLRTIYENNRRLAQLQGAYSGQTVYVVGSGPSLQGFEPEWLAELERCPSIGLNRSTYLVRTPYFLSAYLSENLLALERKPATTCLHVRPSVTVPLAEKILTAKRVYSEDPEVIGREWSFEDPTLYTRNNAMFAATHLGLIMGAATICYVGIEQRNALHFYNNDAECQEQMFHDMRKVIAGYEGLLGRDHPYETPYEMMRRLFESPKELAKRQFYTMDHSTLLNRWFDFMNRSLNAGGVSCAPDSVICDAGAPYLPLSHCLEFGWQRDPRRQEQVRGFLEGLEIESDHLRIRGWAADLANSQGCKEVLLMTGDSLVCRVPVACERQDVAGHLGNPGFLRTGFDARVPLDLAKRSLERILLRAYAKTEDGRLFRLTEPARG